MPKLEMQSINPKACGQLIYPPVPLKTPYPFNNWLHLILLHFSHLKSEQLSNTQKYYHFRKPLTNAEAGRLADSPPFQSFKIEQLSPSFITLECLWPMQRRAGCWAEGGRSHWAPPEITSHKASCCVGDKVFYTLNNLLEAKFVAQN